MGSLQARYGDCSSQAVYLRPSVEFHAVWDGDGEVIRVADLFRGGEKRGEEISWLKRRVSNVKDTLKCIQSATQTGDRKKLENELNRELQM